MLTKNEPIEIAALRQKIVDLAGEYARLAHVAQPFVPGSSPVPVSGKVVGEPELQYLIDASLDLWLTTGATTPLSRRSSPPLSAVGSC